MSGRPTQTSPAQVEVMRQLLLLFSAVFLFSSFFAGLSYGSDEGGSKSLGSPLRHLWAPKEGAVSALQEIREAFEKGEIVKVRRTAEAARSNLRLTLKQVQKEIETAARTQQAYSQLHEESFEEAQVQIQKATDQMQMAIAQIHASHSAKRAQLKENEKAAIKKGQQLNVALENAGKEGDYLRSLLETLDKREAVVSAAGEEQDTLLHELLNDHAHRTPWISMIEPTPALPAEGRKHPPVSPVILRDPAHPSDDTASDSVQPPALVDERDGDRPSQAVMTLPDTLTGAPRGEEIFNLGVLENPVAWPYWFWNKIPYTNSLPLYRWWAGSGKYSFSLQGSNGEKIGYQFYNVSKYPNIKRADKNIRSETVTVGEPVRHNGIRYKEYIRQYYTVSDNNPSEVTGIVIELYATPVRAERAIFEGDKIVRLEIDVTPDGGGMIDGVFHPKVTMTIASGHETESGSESTTAYLPGLGKKLTEWLTASNNKKENADESTLHKLYAFRRALPYYWEKLPNGRLGFRPGLYTMPQTEVLHYLLGDALTAIYNNKVLDMLDEWTVNTIEGAPDKKILAITGETPLSGRSIVRWLEKTQEKHRGNLIDGGAYVELTLAKQSNDQNAVVLMASDWKSRDGQPEPDFGEE